MGSQYCGCSEKSPYHPCDRVLPVLQALCWMLCFYSLIGSSHTHTNYELGILSILQTRRWKLWEVCRAHCHTGGITCIRSQMHSIPKSHGPSLWYTASFTIKLEGGSLMCPYHGYKPDEGWGRIRECHVCLRERPGPQQEALTLCWRKERGMFASDPLPSLQALLVWSHKKPTEKRGLICIEKVEKLLRRIPNSHVYHQTLLISQRFSKHIPKLNGVIWGKKGASAVK